jgi:hypothetical protein
VSGLKRSKYSRNSLHSVAAAVSEETMKGVSPPSSLSSLEQNEAFTRQMFAQSPESIAIIKHNLEFFMAKNNSFAEFYKIWIHIEAGDLSFHAKKAGLQRQPCVFVEISMRSLRGMGHSLLETLHVIQYLSQPSVPCHHLERY